MKATPFAALLFDTIKGFANDIKGGDLLVDIISKDGIYKCLSENSKTRFNVSVVEKTESTNLLLKNMALNGAEEGSVVVAGEQTAGIGRMGRSFFSPGNTGIYMSILLKPQIKPEKSVFITTAAAVAVCRALEKNGVGNCGIKWVNDIYINGKKVCGILTQGNINPQSKELDFAILGIGINVYKPENDFPDEITNIAGAVFDKEIENLRNKLVADVLTEFNAIYKDFDNTSYVDEYINKSFIIGKKVDVISGSQVKEATVLGINKDCKLHIEYEDGVQCFLDSGEISVKLL